MMPRTNLSLNGPWQFWADPEAWLSPSSLKANEGKRIHVPAPWQSQSADLRFYLGVGWYHRQVEIPAEWFDNRAIILHFDAASYLTEVWFNDAKIGEHEGGYLLFEFDVTEVARPGLNHITVRVADTSDLFAEIPHGKQSWYGPLSGIWQSVWLECRSPFHVQSLRLFPDLNSGCVQAQITFSAAGHHSEAAIDQPDYVIAEVIDSNHCIVTSTQSAVPAKSEGMDLAVTVPNPLAWSHHSPHLYLFRVHLVREGEIIDTTMDRFGFRTIEAHSGRLLLNGEPIYLRGALDQDYYPDIISTAPSREFLEDEFRKAKELGLNCLRCHIKVPDPLYYEVADEMGLLIWTELPNWHIFSEKAAQRGRETLQGIIERDGNHPSIIAWTIINEDWGTDLVHDASHRAWLKETYHWLKKLDPTRLVVDNSPCRPNFHIETDIEDFHHYRAMPDNRRHWDRFVNTFAERASWTYSPHGDAVRTGQEPLVVSEFGNWGLPDVELLLDADGEEPWWFETGHDWAGGVVYPHGVCQRFQTWSLDRVFGNWRAFVEATQWQQHLSLKYEIESMRLRPEIVGYVITELNDVHWECNGLLDMNRNTKAFHAIFADINAGTVIVPKWERVTYWAGEPVQIDLAVAHGEGQSVADARLLWRVTPGTEAGQLTAPYIEAGQVWLGGDLTFTAPEVTTPTALRLELELRASDGRLLATNYLELTLFPRWEGPFAGHSLLWTPDEKLAERLAELGYHLSSERQAADAVVVNKLDEELITYVREGGRLLLLAEEATAIEAEHLGIRLMARNGSVWSGDWASSFTWIRRQGPFARLPGGPLIDHSFDGVIPEQVMVGFNAWDFKANVHSGLFVGWIHQPVALIAEKRYGKGRSVLTTFRLTGDEPGVDPMATTLLHTLIELTLTR